MVGTLAKEIRKFIIKPVLEVTNLWTPAAEILVYGTGHVESGYSQLFQCEEPKNGGIGYFQDEVADYADLCRWLRIGDFLSNKSSLLANVLSALYYEVMPGDYMLLASNIKFAAIVCRLHYYRVSDPLPPANDAFALANYHKIHYNSVLGKADVAKNTDIFQKIIDGHL